MRRTIASRSAALSRFSLACRARPPLEISLATTSAMTGTAIQPVARNALIERSRNASGATIAAMRRPGARHFAKLTMVKLRSGMSWETGGSDGDNRYP